MTDRYLFRGFHPCENGTESVWIEGKEIKGIWIYGYIIDCCDFVGIIQIDEYGELIDIYTDESGTMDGYIWFVLPETVGQYTGLMDKNGTRIFEGDIVSALFWNEHPVNSVVKFKNGAFGLAWMRCGVEMFYAFTSICNVTYEILGNIHSDRYVSEE